LRISSREPKPVARSNTRWWSNWENLLLEIHLCAPEIMSKRYSGLSVISINALHYRFKKNCTRLLLFRELHFAGNTSSFKVTWTKADFITCVKSYSIKDSMQTLERNKSWVAFFFFLLKDCACKRSHSLSNFKEKVDYDSAL
jgi:hypothetical protein